MNFNPTSINVVELLVVALAVVAVFMWIRHRYTSNVPLLSYILIFVFSNFTDRSLNPYLLYGGLALALLVRFEFMGVGFAKATGWLATGSLSLIIWVMMSDVLA